MTSFSTHQVKVRSKTWTRDSYGLYDYEASKDIFIQNLTLTSGCIISRVQNEIIQTNALSTLNTESKDDTLIEYRPNTVIASLSDGKDGIEIQPNKLDKDVLDGSFWHVMEKGETTERYELKVNDVIRLGRVAFRINQIKVIEDTTEKVNSPDQKQIIESIKAHMQKDPENGDEMLPEPAKKLSDSNVCCKICLCENDEPDDPMISPCECIGSVRYVHLKCIQNWVKSKLNIQENKNIVTIYWKNLSCELCKTKFPLNVRHHGQELSLIPIENKITGSYVVMESFSKERNSTGVHLIDLSSDQDFRMGRGHDCELKIPDISVSRIHALLAVMEGKLYLKDNGSKFGTLVQHQGPLILNEAAPETQWVQYGRSIFKFALTKQWLTILPCFGSCNPF